MENLRLDHQIPLSVHSPFISILWNLNFPGCVSPSVHLVLWVCEAVPKGWTQHEKGRSWDFPTVTIPHWKVKESSTGTKAWAWRSSPLCAWALSPSPTWEGSHYSPLCTPLSSFPHILSVSKRVFLQHSYHSPKGALMGKRRL